MVVEVDPGLSGVQLRWGCPLNPAAVDADGPALFGEPVVGAAGEDFLVDVGPAVVCGPAADVVDLAVVPRHGAAGFRAPPIPAV